MNAFTNHTVRKSDAHVSVDRRSVGSVVCVWSQFKRTGAGHQVTVKEFGKDQSAWEPPPVHPIMTQRKAVKDSSDWADAGQNLRGRSAVYSNSSQ